MNADLERLIELQKLDSRAHEAQRKLAAEPQRLQALEALLDAARQQVAASKACLAENQTARRAIEKDVAVHQGRLSKFRDQAMAVKTNQEYHAIQHEISFAQTEIKRLEDRELELMIEADELTAAVKRSETELTAAQKSADAERAAITAENAELHALIAHVTAERARIAEALAPGVLSMFEMVSARRNGVAVAEARDGICTICHVRLRPQLFNTVLRNDQIVQCDSCHRILYFVPAPASDPQPTS
jgi:predicted  nucleic acid-binding Zn-ribbon protein